MKIYAIVSGECYKIVSNKAHKCTWDFEAGTMTVADSESAITIPTTLYTYDEMYKKMNVAYYINYYEGTQLQTGVTATPKTTSQTIKPSKGYDGLKQVVVEATPLETQNVTPSTSEQEIEAQGEGKIGLSKVTVAAVTSAIDDNIVAGNIKNGVTILGVTGSYTGE